MRGVLANSYIEYLDSVAAACTTDAESRYLLLLMYYSCCRTYLPTLPRWLYSIYRPPRYPLAARPMACCLRHRFSLRVYVCVCVFVCGDASLTLTLLVKRIAVVLIAMELVRWGIGSGVLESNQGSPVHSTLRTPLSTTLDYFQHY